jgi:hypothetical protein
MHADSYNRPETIEITLPLAFMAAGRLSISGRQLRLRFLVVTKGNRPQNRFLRRKHTTTYEFSESADV